MCRNWCFLTPIAPSEGLMSLLQGLGRAYSALAQFECKRALELFSALPPQHYNTGWVTCQVGRAHFEMAEYQKVSKTSIFLKKNAFMT